MSYLKPGTQTGYPCRILGVAPASAFVTNTLIADSAGYGFDLGWTGDPIDFTPTNTFANLACLSWGGRGGTPCKPAESRTLAYPSFGRATIVGAKTQNGPLVG